jgi:hypothetical protein
VSAPDPVIQQKTWEIVINNIALRPTSGKTKTVSAPDGRVLSPQHSSF